MARKNLWQHQSKRGKKQHYLGMDLNFENERMVKVSMIPYKDEIMNNFSEEIGTLTAAAPAR